MRAIINMMMGSGFSWIELKYVASFYSMAEKMLSGVGCWSFKRLPFIFWVE